MSANSPGQLSPDGAYYWNGQQWVSTLSPDGAHRWNGTAWVATAPQPPPMPAGMPAAGVPGMAPAPPGGAGAIAVARPPVNRSGLGFQFSGNAGWSIGFGLASMLAPLFAQFYFILLPIFGFTRGLLAVRSGRVVGGTIGIVLNIIGGILSLLASGIIHG